MNDATRAAQQDVHQARAELGETIDTLKRKLSVGDLVNELFSGSGQNGASRMLSNLSRQAQQNPLAITMIGAGMAWLMMGDREPRFHGSHHEPRSHGSHSAHDDVRPSGTSGIGSAAASARSTFGDAADRAGSSARDAVGAARDAASSARERAAHGYSALSERASESYGSMVGGAQDTAHDVGRGAVQARDYMQQTAESLLERQPLVLGALAVAVGAAIGAALPSTRLENQHLGEASERAKEELASIAETVRDRGMGIASHAGDAAMREAKEQGLASGEAEGGSTSTIAERVEKVGRAAAGAARDDLRQQADESRSASPATSSPSARKPGSRPI